MSNQPFCHLHGHSEFSQRDTVGSAKEIVEVAAKRGFESVPFTDHGTISGWFDLQEACKKEGIHPIYGIEFYVAPDGRMHKSVTDAEKEVFEDQVGRPMLKDESKKIQKARKKSYHMVALAYNQKGIENLYRLTTDSNTNGFYYRPRTDWDMLQQHSEGLIISTACGNGVLARPFRDGDTALLEHNTKRLMEIFPGRLFLEMQLNDWKEQMGVNRKMIEIAMQHGLPLSITQDFHYPNAEDKLAREFIKAIDYGYDADEVENHMTGKHTMHVCTYEEARKFWEMAGYESAFGWEVFDQAIANTKAIESEIIRNAPEPDFSTRKFPTFPIPSGFSDQTQYFNHLVRQGWDKRLPQMGKAPGSKSIQDYQTRLQKEINIIHKMGFIDYFLIVGDMMSWSKNNGIACGAARGSGGGSVLSWILNITEIDPLRWGLSFERFLNPARTKAPDIDCDFSDVDRPIVKQYLVDKWGQDNVATIGSYIRYKPKSAFLDVCGLYDVPANVKFSVSKKMNNDHSFASNVARIGDLKSLIDKFKMHKAVPVLDRLYHLIRNTSQAAAGVIISEKPLYETTSLRRIPKKDENNEVIVTEIEGDKLGDAGFLKMDVLGISELTILKEAGNKIPYIKEYNEKAGYELAWFYEQCDLEDPEVWKRFQEGDTLATFQMKGHSITELTKNVKPENILELAAIQALHRPQPLQLGYADAYWRRKHGIEKISSIHPHVDSVFSDTYGVMVFQEQFIEVFYRLGMEYGDADILRRQCEDLVKDTKKDRAQQKRDKIMAEFRAKEPPVGLTREDVEHIVSSVMGQVGYSFNMSHSVAYSLLSYYGQYMKTYHPEEFWVSVLNVEMNKSADKQDFMRPFHRLSRSYRDNGKKLTVTTGTINSFSPFFQVVHDENDNPFLYVALMKAKGIKKNATVALLKFVRDEGPFQYLSDFFNREKFGKIDKRVMTILIQLGMFDGMPLDQRNQVVMNRAQLMEWFVQYAPLRKSKKKRDEIFSAYQPASVPYSEASKAEMEIEVLNMLFTCNPFEEYGDVIKKVADAAALSGREAVVGAVTASKKRRSSTLLTLSTDDGDLEVVVFDDSFPKSVSIVMNVMYIFEIQHRENWSNPIVKKIIPLSVETNIPTSKS